MDGHIVGFPPVFSANPRILILGTMPSVASLEAGQYYAHPANAFWKILSAIKGIDCPVDYEEKKQIVITLNLALWDVCHTCIRPGSADSAISQEESNGIAEFLAKHASIRTILFNGQTAEKLFRRHLNKTDKTGYWLSTQSNPILNAIIPDDLNINKPSIQKNVLLNSSIRDAINTFTMPSTSPAYTLPFEKKLAVWYETILTCIKV